MTDARLVSAIRAATDVMRRATAIDLRLELAMDRFQRLLRQRTLERRYNPDWRQQPRAPRGDPDGGQWTRGPGRGGGEDDRTVPSNAVARDGQRPARRLVPAEPAASDANVVVKELSRWLSDPATFEAVDAVLGVGSWLFEFRRYITAYLQPPRTLDELRAAGKQPQPGFDRHHFVEKGFGAGGRLRREHDRRR